MEDKRLEYAEKVCEILRSVYDIECQAEMIPKNNIELPAVLVAISERVNPVFYVDEYECKHVPFEEVVKKILERLKYITSESNMMENIAKDMESFEKVKDYIFWNLLSIQNKENVAKSDCIYKEFLDMIIVPCIRFETDSVSTAIRVKRRMLEVWNISEDAIFQAAAENIDRNTEIINVENTLIESGAIKEAECIPQNILYAIRFNPMYGAGAMLNINALQYFCHKIGAKYAYILPSSVHEVLLLPTDELNLFAVENFTNIINEINNEVLLPEERLTNSLYFFDGERIILPEN